MDSFSTPSSSRAPTPLHRIDTPPRPSVADFFCPSDSSGDDTPCAETETETPPLLLLTTRVVRRLAIAVLTPATGTVPADIIAAATMLCFVVCVCVCRVAAR